MGVQLRQHVTHVARGTCGSRCRGAARHGARPLPPPSAPAPPTRGRSAARAGPASSSVPRVIRVWSSDWSTTNEPRRAVRRAWRTLGREPTLGSSAQTPASAARVIRERLACAVRTTIRRSACRASSSALSSIPSSVAELDVHDRQIGRQLVDQAARRRRVVGLPDALDVGQPVEREHQEVGERPMVVDHQDALHACSDVRPRLFVHDAFPVSARPVATEPDLPE